jgi:hypothetical protein
MRSQDVKCPMGDCTRSYTRDKDLNRHLKTKHEDGIFTCRICGDQKRFCGYDVYRKHIAKMHTRYGAADRKRSDSTRPPVEGSVAETTFFRLLALQGVPQSHLSVFPVIDSPPSVMAFADLEEDQSSHDLEGGLSVPPTGE